MKRLEDKHLKFTFLVPTVNRTAEISSNFNRLCKNKHRYRIKTIVDTSLRAYFSRLRTETYPLY